MKYIQGRTKTAKMSALGLLSNVTGKQSLTLPI